MCIYTQQNTSNKQKEEGGCTHHSTSIVKQKFPTFPTNHVTNTLSLSVIYKTVYQKYRGQKNIFLAQSLIYPKYTFSLFSGSFLYRTEERRRLQDHQCGFYH